MKNKLSLFSILVLLAGCTTTESYISLKNMNAKPEDCPLKVFMPGQKIDNNYDVIGSFSVQEAGFSLQCGWEDTLEKNKSYACEKGANAIQFLNVDAPSVHSTCYTSKANFIIIK